MGNLKRFSKAKKIESNTFEGFFMTEGVAEIGIHCNLYCHYNTPKYHEEI